MLLRQMGQSSSSLQSPCSEVSLATCDRSSRSRRAEEGDAYYDLKRVRTAFQSRQLVRDDAPVSKAVSMALVSYSRRRGKASRGSVGATLSTLWTCGMCQEGLGMLSGCVWVTV